MNHIIRNMFAAASLTLIGGVANAQLVELQQNAQDPLPSGSYADNYYNGGFAGNSYTSGPIQNYPASGPGPSLGFTFSSNANVQSGGVNQGKFQNLPTDPDNNTQVLYFSVLGGSTTTDTINFSTGFTGVTFNYALASNDPDYDQTADVWSGLNGTGTLLGTIALNSAATTIPGTTRQYIYTTWSSATDDSLSGVGQSVTFGVANSAPSENLEIDAFTVDAVPIPEPATYGAAVLAGVGLLLASLRDGFRRIKA
jgi:hypothetical protein